MLVILSILGSINVIPNACGGICRGVLKKLKINLSPLRSGVVTHAECLFLIFHDRSDVVNAIINNANI